MNDMWHAVAKWIGDWSFKAGVCMGLLSHFIEENVGLLSFIVAVIGMGSRMYYDRRENKRNEQLYRARLERIKSGSEDR